MIGLNLTMAIITLNVNGLNTPIKRQRLSGWIKKQDLKLYWLREVQFTYNGHK